MRTHHRIYCTVYDDDDARRATHTHKKNIASKNALTSNPDRYEAFITTDRGVSERVVLVTYWDCWEKLWVFILRGCASSSSSSSSSSSADGARERDGTGRSTIDEDEDEDEDEFARGYDSRRRLATATRDGDGGISVLISVSCG